MTGMETTLIGFRVSFYFADLSENCRNDSRVTVAVNRIKQPKDVIVFEEELTPQVQHYFGKGLAGQKLIEEAAGPVSRKQRGNFALCPDYAARTFRHEVWDESAIKQRR